MINLKPHAFSAGPDGRCGQRNKGKRCGRAAFDRPHPWYPCPHCRADLSSIDHRLRHLERVHPAA